MRVALYTPHTDEQFSTNYNRAKICLRQNYTEHHSHLPLIVQVAL